MKKKLKKEPTWQMDQACEDVARAVFEEHDPRVWVHRSDRFVQYLIEGTPYGRVEMAEVAPSWFVAAAENPPVAIAETEKKQIPPSLAAHFKKGSLIPWRVVRGAGTFQEALQRLTVGTQANSREATANDELDAEPGFKPWSPHVALLPDEQPLIGRPRVRIAEDIACLLDAQTTGTPYGLPVLEGIEGVGRRTLAAHVARLRGGRAVELMLRRMLLPRFMTEPAELTVEHLLGADSLDPGDVLVLTDFGALLTDRSCRPVLRELSHRHRTLALADPVRRDVRDAGGRWSLVWQTCPGTAVDEAPALISTHLPDTSFEDGALEKLATLATVGGHLIPGRLILLTRLIFESQARVGEGKEAGPRRVYPDDLGIARRMSRQLWGQGE